MRIFPTVPPRPDETPASLVSRLAVRHNALSVRSFSLDMGMPFQAIVDGKPEAVQRVAELVGCPVEPLRNAAITKIGPAFILRSQQLQKASLRRARVLVCPRCIVEDLADEASPWMASGRVDWLLDPIRACRHHGVTLTEIANGDTPTPLHDFARCLAPSLVEIPRLAGEAQVVQPSPLERYLIDRLDGRDDQAWLDAVPWYAAAKCCEMIGAVELFGRKAPIKTLTDDQWREAGAAGYEIACGGDAGIRAFLEQMRSTYPESHSDGTGPQAWFGRLHTWLTDVCDDAYDPLRNIVVDVVREMAPVGPEDTLYGRPIVDERRLHTIRTAALETGLHPKRLRRLLAAAGTIPSNHRELTDDRVVFSAPEAEAILAKAKHAISEREAETYLNAGRVHARLLAREGFIVPFASSRQEALKGHHAYDTRELDEFLAALAARAEVMSDHADPIYRIPEAAKRANCSAAEIVRAILDCKLAWVGQIAGERGYMSMLVDLMEVRDLVRGDHGDKLTLTTVQASLRTTSQVVDALVRSRILPSERAISPMNRCPYTAVRTADLDAFRATFGSLHEIARDRGVHFAPLKKALSQRGINPAFGKPAVPATFYRRADIPSDL
jgi:hypothetical protein